MIKKGLIAMSIALITGASVFAQIDETITQTFHPEGGQGHLSIKNSFGDITIKHHSKETMEIKIEINVVPTKEKNYEKVKDKVRIDIREVGNKLELRTVNELNGISISELDIDYTAFVPKNTILEISNQFGNVWIEGTSAQLIGRAQHGDFFSGDVTGNNNSLKVQFGNLRLESLVDAEIKIQHGDLEADRFENVELDVMFSDAEVDNVSGYLDIDLQHSELSIEKVEPALNKLQVDGQFSDIKLQEGDWHEFSIEMEGSFTDFSMPASLKSMINYELKEMHNREYRINRDITNKIINIDANHSDVDFK